MTVINLKGTEREIAQAKNIQKIINEKPFEKFLIHCGFDHALEGEHSSWVKAMAARLKEFTGIDPLTINQVKYSERNNRNYNQPLLKAIQIEKPSILLNSEKKPFQYKKGAGWSDIAILHPNTLYIKGRPRWLINDGKQLVKFKTKNFEIDYPIMGLAYKKGENIDEAIPVDIIEVQSKSDESYFVLNKGNYNVVIANKEDQTFKYELEVK